MVTKNLKLNNKTVVFTGGGTGGHLWPLVSVVRWTKIRYGIKPVYFGTGTKLERRVWRRENVRQVTIPSGKKRNYASWRNIFDYFWLGVGFIKALIWLSAVRPGLVVGKGGYGMLPTIVAARWLGIRVVSHESDIVMGRANRYALDHGHIVLTAFPADFYDATPTQKTRLRYVGMPIHPDFYHKFETLSDDLIARPKIEKALKNKVKKTILVFGGSQGSTRINDLIVRLWPRLSEFGHVVHITGEVGYKSVQNIYRNVPKDLQEKIEVHKEVDDLPTFIRRASVVIARAGSTSLWEIASSATPSLIIPLPEAAADHQRLNAVWFAQEFPFISVIEEKSIQDEEMLGRIKRKLTHENIDVAAPVVMPDFALRAVGDVIYEELVANYLASPHHFHLVGAQGVSMKGIAELLKHGGHTISGSDVASGGHSALNITGDIDAVIYSSAVADEKSPGHIELKVANDKGIPTFKRARFIKDMMNVNRIVAVSGMHGKSTTTSMVVHILKEMGLDPSYLIGVPDTVPADGYMGGASKGRDNLFVLEACEYDRSFYQFPADLAVITNVEEEHLDYFKGGLKEIENSFVEFLSILRPGATVVTADSDPSVTRIIKSAEAERPDLVFVKQANASNQIKINRSEYQFFGDHNFRNAQLAVETVFHFGISRDDGWRSLKTFRGARRRLEYIGLSNGALVYDDYGHHPTEILADIEALKKKYPDRELTMVFQPHQVSRTKLLFNDFVASLSRADNIIITDIHKVTGREEKETVTGEELAQAVAKKNKNACYVASPYDNIVEYLQGKIDRKDMVLTVGATDICEVAKGLVDGN